MYAGCSAKNSPQDYIYRIYSRYAKGQKLDTILKSVFDRKPVTSKSKGEIITPKNKMKLQKLVKLKKQYLGDIDISNIKDLSFLFEDVDRNDFAGIENWDTSKVTTMQDMFRYSNFNENISTWDTSKVKNFSFMFEENKVFNQPIDKWDTSSATNFSCMFYQAEAFNQPIGAWNTKKATNMHYMFGYALSFCHNVGYYWDLKGVKDTDNMFREATAYNRAQKRNKWD
ncbi:BspA family leucine-rich repeat surface protein [Helicobacter hepaticus]|uniref:BspA family leucine-rich repeat surface protein n=2 Tax=Helicobacter hepaticus TaxID=32025 RepID=Q7VI78_HELHP|nr:BspA family leucine-rich repeat surface protein [Helicobacter hepaticus]AAP77327.1 hypothetical protein HH_0730 [Helicobacter hepaticus ATCC 51449]